MPSRFCVVTPCSPLRVTNIKGKGKVLQITLWKWQSATSSGCFTPHEKEPQTTNSIG
jgi:hypothetical protein